MSNELVLYRRARSTIWQCRFKIDGTWQRASTKQRDLAKAKNAARDLWIAASVRKAQNLPVVTRKFRHVARLASQRMRDELAVGRGKVSYSGYERVIEEYLIPFFGNYSITSIDSSALTLFDEWRTKRMGKAPMQSTLMTHNAALNRVFDEAVDRGFMTKASRPELVNKGKEGERRPAFEVEEARALRSNFDAWIERGRTPGSKEQRALLRDYVEVLLDTGARPGDELLNLKWRQVQFVMRPSITKSNETDEDEQRIELAELNRSCLMTVDGKTGMREIAGMRETVKALVRVIDRNYGVKNKITEPFKGIAVPSNDDFVFRTKDKGKPANFQKMFESYLEEHNLLIDPVTGQKRVFYSLRHTYATMALTHDVVPLETLRVQMGTSIAMIAKHYSHLKVRNTLDQLRRGETRRLLESGEAIDEMYKARAKSAIKKAKPEVDGDD
ncbi:hypothetical protein Q8X39_11980 [Leptothrix discophora]|uniref:Tyr recombinase domain-containing protein n=2 Tax=Leptothrix discophora TaxID=89 RepID=A0ABT9G4E1_LEPDI|nr:hypothetical protein [Leptothrix discophora]